MEWVFILAAVVAVMMFIVAAVAFCGGLLYILIGGAKDVLVGPASTDGADR